MTAARRLAVLTPLVAIATSGCFATRNDMRVLQGDILAFRTEAQRADSARARQIATVAASLGTVGDSLRDVSTRLARFQGDTRGDIRQIQQQLLQIQELTGQSQRKLQDLRADMEARAQQAAVVPVTPVPGDTSKGAATPGVPAAPGPNQLYQLAYDQLRRASYGAARTGFEELIRSYPTSDLAPESQFYIAESYAAEGATASGDSAYTLVVSKYPKSTKAATALYKLGLSLAKQGKKSDARSAMDRVVREYPNSDDAELARDWLRSNR